MGNETMTPILGADAGKVLSRRRIRTSFTSVVWRGFYLSLGNLKIGERFEEILPLARREVSELVRLADVAELGKPKVEKIRLAVEIDHGELSGNHGSYALRD